MNHEAFFQEMLAELTANWHSLDDRPEETPYSTLCALWFLAAGEARAVERCNDAPMPPLDEAARRRLKDLIRRRLEGTPLAHLTGRQCFMDIEMLAGPEALIPRKETEILGYGALDLLARTVGERGDAVVMDLCTGCGNLALALAHHEPECRVYAADLSQEAVDLAHRNARYLGLDSRVRFYVGDLFAPFENDDFYESADLVVCNPPYISTRHITEMPEEIHAHEPHLAFDGGAFGVSILFRLISGAPQFLKPGGWLCFEVGLGQGDLIHQRLLKHGAYKDVSVRSDGGGNPRVLLARRSGHS